MQFVFRSFGTPIAHSDSKVRKILPCYLRTSGHRMVSRILPCLIVVLAVILTSTPALAAGAVFVWCMVCGFATFYTICCWNIVSGTVPDSRIVRPLAKPRRHK